ERLLIDRICVCWLEVYHGDIDLVEHLSQHLGANPSAHAAQKRLDAAHRRYLTAIKTLATVQKLLKPARSPFALLSRPVREAPAAQSVRRRGPRLPIHVREPILT